MRHIITDYASKNGLTFHHTISTYENGSQNKLVSEFTPESHYMYEVFLLLAGSIRYKIEGQYYSLSPFDAIIIYPNKLHSIEIAAAQPYERMVLHFSPDLLPQFVDLNFLSHHDNSILPSVIPKKIIQQSNLANLMQQCQEICLSKDKYIDLRLVGIILQVVETLNEILLKLDETNTLPPIKVDKISHTCIQYINQNLTSKDKLSPQYLAKELHISVSHLRHTFKKEIGVTLHDYIFNQKMQLARKLLVQGRNPQVVSNLLGYEYYSSFYHNFVKRFGSPPNSCAELQQKNWENVDI